MANAGSPPFIKGEPAQEEGLLHCICSDCGEPNFHQGIGLYHSKCKNYGLRGTYYVILDEVDMETVKRQI